MLGRTRSEATTTFTDAVSLWRLHHGNTAEVIDAAVECLLAELDSPTLCELAGESPARSRFDLAPMIEQTLQELGLANVLTVSPDAGAMAVMARRFERGELSARDLCDWAHRSIGHDGDGSCQVFVELDDVFDTVEYYDDEDEESLERRTVEAVHAFLNARR